jgi:hypothetical protein
MHIGKISVRDVTVNASLIALGKDRGEKSITVDDFTLTNVGGENGATVKQVIAQVIKALIEKARDAGGKDLLQKLGVDTDKLKEKAAEELKDIGKGILGGDK